MIAVVNSGVGNLKSVLLALRRACPDSDVRVAFEKKTLREADRVVFPGQGSMRNCIETLNHLEILDELKNCLATKPFLGICLGKQILFDSSEEGTSPGLGLISGKVERFTKQFSVKIPHMGWNTVKLTRNHPVFSGILKSGEVNAYFYFVHSFFSNPNDKSIILGETVHGTVFPSIVSRENIIATQFHPEKSAEVGITLLKNFVGWKP